LVDLGFLFFPEVTILQGHKDDWVSQAELDEATRLAKLTVAQLAAESRAQFTVIFSSELDAAQKPNSWDNRLDDLPSVNLRSVWAPSDPRVQAHALLSQIKQHINSSSGNDDTAPLTDLPLVYSTGCKSTVELLAMNLAESQKQCTKNEHFWTVLKKLLIEKAKTGDAWASCVHPLNLLIEGQCESFQTDNLNLVLKAVNNFLGTTVPSHGDGRTAKKTFIVLTMSRLDLLREALKIAAANLPALQNVTWMHPDAFLLGDQLRGESDLDLLQFMDKVNFTAVLLFPTQPFSGSKELNDFKLTLKTHNATANFSTPAVHRAFAFVKTLKTVLSGDPGLPDTWELWNLRVRGFRNRSSLQVRLDLLIKLCLYLITTLTYIEVSFLKK
jgi:hypothetical protein